MIGGTDQGRAALCVALLAFLAFASPRRCDREPRRDHAAAERHRDPLGRQPTGMVKRMPMLDSAEGFTRFNAYYDNNPLCCPTRSTLLTGLYSHHTGIEINLVAENFDDTSTLATWLDDGGYETGLFGKYLNNYPWSRGANYVPPGLGPLVGVHARCRLLRLHARWRLLEAQLRPPAQGLFDRRPRRPGGRVHRRFVALRTIRSSPTSPRTGRTRRALRLRATATRSRTPREAAGELQPRRRRRTEAGGPSGRRSTPTRSAARPRTSGARCSRSTMRSGASSAP